MLYILIPAHNNKREVMAILSCLERQTYREFVIILVDDGSTDGTAEEVRSTFPAVRILKGDGYLWWTGANVLGIDHILREAHDDDRVLLLNNDVLVDEHYVNILMQSADRYGNSLIGSTLVDNNDHDFLESGVRLDHALQLTINRDRIKIESTEFDMDVDVLPGRGTLVPVQVFRAIGSFDRKRLPHYGADYEFSVRARRAGFGLLVSHRARVYADLRITGIVASGSSIISLKECATLLFSKKSKSNIIYYLNFVWLCSDRKHRVRNVIFSARGILAQTLFRTIPFYPVFMVLSAISSIARMVSYAVGHLFKFLFRSYPLRPCDIQEFGFDPSSLLSLRIVEHRPFKHVPYYYLSPMFDRVALAPDQRKRVYQLRRRSFNYFHKLSIVREKLNVLVSREAAR